MNRRKFILWLSGLVAAIGAFFRLRWLSKPPEALPKPPEALPTPWEDVYAMMEDIVNHVDRTGETVVCNDDPWTRQLGYACKTKTWQIRLTSLRGSMGNQPVKGEILRPFLVTAEGRTKIAIAMQVSGMSRRRYRGLVC